MKKTGIELIAQERLEQIEKHGRTIEKDVANNANGELIMAARGLMIEDEEFPIGVAEKARFSEFPADWDSILCRKMCAKSRKERLIIAGALIAAELDIIEAQES